MMRRSYLGTSILVLALVLTASAPAFALNSKMLTLRYDMVLKGTHLQAGQYTVRWESRSPTATVTVSNEKGILVTVEGQLVDRGTKFSRNAVVARTSVDGTRTITEIRFAGSSQVIVFNE